MNAQINYIAKYVQQPTEYDQAFKKQKTNYFSTSFEKHLNSTGVSITHFHAGPALQKNKKYNKIGKVSKK